MLSLGLVLTAWQRVQKFCLSPTSAAHLCVAPENGIEESRIESSEARLGSTAVAGYLAATPAEGLGVGRVIREMLSIAVLPKSQARAAPPSRRLWTRGLSAGSVVWMLATAYDPGPRSCGDSADGVTAIGLKAGRGVVAVDPRIIDLGSRVHVEGYGPAIAGDVGGAIKGKRIDLGYDTYEEALVFGRRMVRVHILSRPARPR